MCRLQPKVITNTQARRGTCVCGHISFPAYPKNETEDLNRNPMDEDPPAPPTANKTLNRVIHLTGPQCRSVRLDFSPREMAP